METSMDKDFDYREFQEFMRNLSGYHEVVNLNNRANTFEILNEMDTLESQVASRPVYQSAEELLAAIQEQS